MWLFKLNYNKIKFKIPFLSCTGHISSLWYLLHVSVIFWNLPRLTQFTLVVPSSLDRTPQDTEFIINNINMSDNIALLDELLGGNLITEDQYQQYRATFASVQRVG